MYSKEAVFRCNTAQSPNGYWIGYEKGDCFIPLGYKSNNSKDVEMTSGIHICDQALEGASFEGVTEKDIPVGIMFSFYAYSSSYSKKEFKNPFPFQKEDARNLCQLILLSFGLDFIRYQAHIDSLDDITECFERNVNSLDDFAIFYWTIHLLVKRDKASVITLGKELPNYFDC